MRFPDQTARSDARRFRSPVKGLLLLIVGVRLGVPDLASAVPITLLNPTTQLVVNGGEANNGLVPRGGYFQYTDIGEAEETTWSIDPVLIFQDGSTVVLSNGSAGGFGSPLSLGGGLVRSTASVSNAGAVISVVADTELVESNARTSFSFTSDTSLDGTTFVFYAENDLFSPGDDEAAFIGSIAGEDLALFMFDSAAAGLSVELTGEALASASLTLFGAGIWTAWGTSLEAGDLSVLSADGSNFEPIGDLGLALAFSLTGTHATVVINYDTQPEPPLCGDVNDDGLVDPSDVATYRSYLSDPNGMPFSLNALLSCSVIGGATDCDVLDVIVLRRFLSIPSLPPGLALVCEAVFTE